MGQITAIKEGAKTFFLIKELTGLLEHMRNLPRKEKSRLETKDAVAFLYEDIQSAVQKGYSLEEVAEIISSFGWFISEKSLRYYCKVCRKEIKNSKSRKTGSRKEPMAKSISEQTQLLFQNTTEGDETEKKYAPETHREVTERKSEALKGKFAEEKEKKRKGTYFDLPPDTEDL